MIKTVVFVGPKHFFMSGVTLRYLKNISEVTETYIISPSPDKLESFHQWLGLPEFKYIDDKIVCKNLDMPEMNFLSKQFCIMNLDKIIDSKYILNIDADVIFNTEISFINNDTITFYLEDEFYPPYFQTIKEIFNLEKILDERDSFVADFMLFESSVLKEIRNKTKYFSNYDLFKKISGKNKDESIGYPAFSEYETYGTWMMHHYPSRMKLKRSDTYSNNVRFKNFLPTRDNIQNNPGIIPIRQTWDYDIDWNQIYPEDWKQFL